MYSRLLSGRGSPIVCVLFPPESSDEDQHPRKTRKHRQSRGAGHSHRGGSPGRQQALTISPFPTRLTVEFLPGPEHVCVKMFLAALFIVGKQPNVHQLQNRSVMPHPVPVRALCSIYRSEVKKKDVKSYHQFDRIYALYNFTQMWLQTRLERKVPKW